MNILAMIRKIIKLIDLTSSPYWGKERIDYLKDVKGFLSIPGIFVLSLLTSCISFFYSTL